MSDAAESTPLVGDPSPAPNTAVDPHKNAHHPRQVITYRWSSSLTAFRFVMRLIALVFCVLVIRAIYKYHDEWSTDGGRYTCPKYFIPWTLITYGLTTLVLIVRLLISILTGLINMVGSESLLGQLLAAILKCFSFEFFWCIFTTARWCRNHPAVEAQVCQWITILVSFWLLWGLYMYIVVNEHCQTDIYTMINWSLWINLGGLVLEKLMFDKNSFHVVVHETGFFSRQDLVPVYEAPEAAAPEPVPATTKPEEDVEAPADTPAPEPVPATTTPEAETDAPTDGMEDEEEAM